MKKTKKCAAYCGVACVSGRCPNALDDLDRHSDTDEYAAYHLDKKQNCKTCVYNIGCADCCFYGSTMCTHEIKGEKNK